jgi:hypothetical protein
MLLLGSVIADHPRWYPENLPERYTVCIIGEVTDQETGKARRTAYIVPVDEDGYFALPNVPSGKYALRGVRVWRESGPKFIIWNELRVPGQEWLQRSGYEWPIPIAEGDIWPYQPLEGVINFGHNVFLMHNPIRHHAVHSITGETFGTPRTYDRPLVLERFIERFPDSGWTPVLRRLLPGR